MMITVFTDVSEGQTTWYLTAISTGWNVTIPEAFQLSMDIPGTLLELREAPTGPGPCEARRLCQRCPEWLSRHQLLKAAKMGHAAARTKLGIELTLR